MQFLSLFTEGYMRRKAFKEPPPLFKLAIDRWGLKTAGSLIKKIVDEVTLETEDGWVQMSEAEKGCKRSRSISAKC